MSVVLCGLRMRWMVLVGALLAVACVPLERHVDRVAGGPTRPADTAVHQQSPLPAAMETEPQDRPQSTTGSMSVTVAEAILLSLENNRALDVQRLTPSIQQTGEDQERAAFDPHLEAAVSAGRLEAERLARTGSQTEAYAESSAEGRIALSQYFPSGTTVNLEADIEMEDSSLYDDRFFFTRMGMTVSQALLRGFGTDANLVRLRQARLDTRMSEYELRGFTASLVADVEQTYWAYALAKRQMEIVAESLKVARQQLDETRELIAVGRLAKSELAAVQAEVAAQEQSMIEARANKESIRLRLLRLLNPQGPGMWQREVELVHRPVLPDITLEPVDRYVAVAMRMHPALNQARLEIQHGELEVVKTRNGLLPVLDLFVTLGKSGYAETFGKSVEKIDGDAYDAAAGLTLQLPVANRSAKALHRRAQLTHEQSRRALANLAQLVEVDVRIAYLEVDRTKQQITASSVTRRFDEEKLRIETEKLRVGKSTSFLVAQAQRDLLVSRIAEVRALANYLNALVDLYRQDGSLLARRRIAAPGREPVTLSGN
jgi:outer membrane protein